MRVKETDIWAAPEIMNIHEAAKYLRVRPSSLYRIAKRGGVPATKIGGQWRFKKSMLDRFFDANAIPPKETFEPWG